MSLTARLVSRCVLPVVAVLLASQDGIAETREAAVDEAQLARLVDAIRTGHGRLEECAGKVSGYATKQRRPFQETNEDNARLRDSDRQDKAKTFSQRSRFWVLGSDFRYDNLPDDADHGATPGLVTFAQTFVGEQAYWYSAPGGSSAILNRYGSDKAKELRRQFDGTHWAPLRSLFEMADMPILNHLQRPDMRVFLKEGQVIIRGTMDKGEWHGDFTVVLNVDQDYALDHFEMIQSTQSLRITGKTKVTSQVVRGGGFLPERYHSSVEYLRDGVLDDSISYVETATFQILDNSDVKHDRFTVGSFAELGRTFVVIDVLPDGKKIQKETIAVAEANEHWPLHNPNLGDGVQGSRRWFLIANVVLAAVIITFVMVKLYLRQTKRGIRE